MPVAWDNPGLATELLSRALDFNEEFRVSGSRRGEWESDQSFEIRLRFPRIWSRIGGNDLPLRKV